MSYQAEIREYIVTTFAPDIAADELPDDLDLFDAGVIDSLGLLRLISWVGERFDIRVEDQDISPGQFSSVTAITDFVTNVHSLI